MVPIIAAWYRWPADDPATRSWWFPTVSHPGRVAGLCLISLEDIEDDAGKLAEIAFVDAFADRMRAQGIAAAWEPILPDLSPVIGAMVREAMDDADPSRLAAAARIFPGDDWRHPATLAIELAARLPRGAVGKATMSNALATADDFAQAFASEISAFLRTVPRGG